MGQSTPATAVLKAGGVSFELRTYEYDPNSDRVGLQAAQSLGEPPGRVLKTLIAQVDNIPVCLVLPSDCEASMKRVAAAVGGKSARMLAPSDAERLTGYKVGGVSPFGQKRKLRTLVEITAVSEPYVFVNGGLRGLQVKLAPDDLVRASNAATVAIVS
ncbi:Cys-tRNA(Pro) deacylase [Bosea sp. 2YAB26]|uniref:Cys-tRNA(Pro) deacylase n=1 Tax=Bosea sp. 2YAB26 TaxID=3237478 RepID=UPI003F938895